MGKIILVLGGTRSGKSNYALNLAKRESRKVAFIATCKPMDNEMRRRVILHRRNRPSYWKTFEHPRDMSLLLKNTGSKFEIIIIDCLTLFVSDLILAGVKESVIRSKIKILLKVLKEISAQVIIVSNEVGLGVVPENKLARDFRDIAGRMNQIVAGKSDEVYFMVSGLPLKVK